MVKSPSKVWGTAIITATKAADNNYNAASDSYILTVNDQRDQSGFGFAQDAITLVYEAGATTSNVATGGKGAGAITYSIDDTSVATVDNNGQVTIKGAGTAKITATKAGDTTYNLAVDSYILTVNKAQQQDLSFAKTAITETYSAGRVIDNVATGGTGVGAISYSIDNNSVATVFDDGYIIITGAGTAKITATKAGNSNYNAVSNSYILTVHKAQQNGFSFAQESITIVYKGVATISNIATGDKGAGAITYDIDKTNVATIDANTGEVTIKNIGTATITASKEANANYHRHQNQLCAHSE